MLPADIIKRIKMDFGVDEKIAKQVLEEKLDGKGFSPRVYRCVVVLAAKSLDKLKEMADLAVEDYRDVIASAEYDKDENQIADYNKPLEN